MSDQSTPPEQMAISIVLADDHEIVRSGIRMVLEEQPDMQVVAEAGDGEGAARYALGHKPQILVLDLNMPGVSGLDAIPRIQEASPATAIIVLTMQAEPAFAREALQSGAKGYVIKQSAASELVGAIRAVIAGDTYINPQPRRPAGRRACAGGRLRTISPLVRRRFSACSPSATRTRRSPTSSCSASVRSKPIERTFSARSRPRRGRSSSPTRSRTD